MNPTRLSILVRPELAHRNELGRFLTELGLTREGVEVGVAFGGFSEIILSQWPGKLHLVDLWSPQDPAVYREVTNFQVDWGLWYGQMLQKMQRFGNRAIPHRSASAAASFFFADNSLDFVYIDANHSFEAVTEDLNLWAPKVKVGGLISGHDYEDNNTGGKWCFVKSAVDKWAAEHKVEISVCKGGCLSWYFFKL